MCVCDFVVRKKEEVVCENKKSNKTPAVVWLSLDARKGLKISGKRKKNQNQNTPIFPNPLPLPIVKTTEEKKSWNFLVHVKTNDPRPPNFLMVNRQRSQLLSALKKTAGLSSKVVMEKKECTRCAPHPSLICGRNGMPNQGENRDGRKM